MYNFSNVSTFKPKAFTPNIAINMNMMHPVYQTNLQAQFAVAQRRHAPRSLKYRHGNLSLDPDPDLFGLSV